MLNKQPLAAGQVYFTGLPQLTPTTFQAPEKPYVIDYQQPKILPFLSAWDNLLTFKATDLGAVEHLLDQLIKPLKTKNGAELQPLDQLWIQLVRGLLSQHQLFIIKDFLDQLPPKQARQLLVTITEITQHYQIITILTTQQQAVFNTFESQVIS